jgi:hypothetical protein
MKRAYALCVLMVLGLMLALVPAALASIPLFIWSGDGATGSGWSTAENWEAEVTPSASGTVALSFPRIPSCVGVCYESENDVSGLSAESIAIDDGNDYKLSGDALTLGAGGLGAAPATGTSGAAGDAFRLPIHLGAEQTWNVSQRSGEPTGENWIALEGAVTGSGDALTVDMNHGSVLYLANDTEVGPLAIDGADMGEAGGLNGLVDLLGAELNTTDGEAVNFNHVLLVGSGAVGALTTNSVGLGVGAGDYPAEGIEAASATFDASSEVVFAISDAGSTAGLDYSQLASAGAVKLSGARIAVLVVPKSESEPCATPAVGRTYTFVSAEGQLSGTFGNAPEDKTIPLVFASESCNPYIEPHLRLAYHESGPLQTVTATVVESAEYAQSTGSSTSTSPGAIEPLPVNEQLEKEFWEHPPWAKAPASSTGGVSLPAGGTLAIERGHTVRVMLDCTGSKECTGKLILTTKTTSRTKSGKKRSHTVTIGTVKFSIPAGKTTIVKVVLNAAGRGLLGKDRGRLAAHVAIPGAAG